MARANLIRLLRTTRSALDTQRASGALYAGEPYLITDENRMAIATAADAYCDLTPAVGFVSEYAGSTAPAGWLFCYGQEISRATYALLFAAIGTTFGVGNGSTTFNVPDARGRVIAGRDDMGGTSANRLTNQSGGLNGDTLGATGGAEMHTLTVGQMPSHSHDIAYHDAGTGGSGGGLVRSTGKTGDSTAFAQSAGSGQSHNNVQPTLILNKIIRAL